MAATLGVTSQKVAASCTGSSPLGSGLTRQALIFHADVERHAERKLVVPAWT
jgi:hypothetical protein